MANYEIRIGRPYQVKHGHFITIVYALVKYQYTWIWIEDSRTMKRGGNKREKTVYLSCLDNKDVSIFEGYACIRGEDLIDTLQHGYVLGTRHLRDIHIMRSHEFQDDKVI